MSCYPCEQALQFDLDLKARAESEKAIIKGLKKNFKPKTNQFMERILKE